MSFKSDVQATRSALMSVDTTLAANIDATQDYIPVASTANFSTSVVAEIETTNEVVSFDSITWNKLWNSQLNVSYWSNTNTTIATGQSAPDGSNDAIKITDDGAGVLFLANAVGSGVNQDSNYIRSIYAKVSPANSGDTANLLGHNSVSSIFTLTDQWQRIQYRAPSTAFATYFYGVDFRGSTATATEIFIWAPQSELSANPASPYVPTFGTSISAGGVQALTTVTRGVNGTTAASATSGDSIQQLPYALGSLDLPIRLRAISVSSDGNGAGRLTLCDNDGTDLCDIDFPNNMVYSVHLPEDGIVFPNGIYISNSNNLTAYTLYTDRYSAPGLTSQNR